MYDVNLKPFTQPQNTMHLLKLMQFFMMNFYTELLLIHAVLRLKRVKGYLRVDAELHLKKVRGLTASSQYEYWCSLMTYQ